ncbi:PepSY-associated TM helix domain-containing protein [Ideonella sp. DXS22W]|uniref:PepSY-associated TM helix domain-containing protein n=1 Tax=Pseudaquabacterium inlustre TaxID=2984192 RepID=A0ABU9CEV1_9BURK
MNRARRLWLAVHRWLGLVLGLWFVLLGLTGSALVFYRGLDEWADPRLAARPGVAASPPLEAVYQALRTAHPQRGMSWRIELPREPGEPITARHLAPVESRGQRFAPLLSSVDPLTRQVVADRFWGQTPGTWLYDLHYTLLLGEAGHQAVGWAGVALAASLVSGLWLWWPAAGGGAGRWRRAWQFKRQAAAPRRVYDLHKLAGLYGGLLLLVLALTGAALALPDLARPLIARFSPLTPMPQLRMPVAAEASRLTGPMDVDAAVARAEQAWPDARARWVDTPAAPGAPYRVRLRQPGEPGDRFPDTLVWIDSRSGQVLARRDPAGFSAGDCVWRWMHPLHSGEAFGLPGRLLVCACGVLPLLLAVTGGLRWWHKRRARQGRPTTVAARAPAARAAPVSGAGPAP